jgi:Ca2+-binding RTX toxin-like protein
MNGGAGSDTVDYSSTGMLTGRYVMIYRNAGVTTALSPLSFTVLSNAQNGVKSMQSAVDGIWVQVDLGSFVPIDAISAQFASAPSAYSVYIGDADMRGLSAMQIEARSDVTTSRQTGTTNTLSLQAAGIVADLTQGTVTKRYGGFTTVADRISNIENVVGTLYNDTLIGDANDNTLSGGAGNDTLTGGAGNDVYLFGRGDGQDTVIDTDSTVLNIDVLAFKSGIAKDQLWFKHIGNDLEISIIDSADKVKIQNWYSGRQNQVEQIEVAGKTLLNTNVEKLVQAMASFSAPASGQITLPTNYQTTLAPVLAANWH